MSYPMKSSEPRREGIFAWCCMDSEQNQHDDSAYLEIEDRRSILIVDQPSPIASGVHLDYPPAATLGPTTTTTNTMNMLYPNNGGRPLTAVSMARSSILTYRRSGRVSMGTLKKQPPAVVRPRTATQRPWTSYGRTKPRISGPTHFRRLSDPLNGSPKEFTPLELSICMPAGRLSPLPDFSNNDWADSPEVDLAMPEPAVVREASVKSSASTSSFTIPRKPVSPNKSRSQSLGNISPNAEIQNRARMTLAAAGSPISPVLNFNLYASNLPGIPTVEEQSRIRPSLDDYTIVQMPRSGESPRAASPEGRNHSRSFSDIVRPLRTSGSLRRSRPSDTVDEAIRELNTIVEERRSSALQKKNSDAKSRAIAYTRKPDHVPAIAPAMKVRARSETLSDIGSAFSTPLAAPAFVQHAPAGSSSTASAATVMQRSSSIKNVVRATNRLKTWFNVTSPTSTAPSSPPPIPLEGHFESHAAAGSIQPQQPEGQQQFYQLPAAMPATNNNVSTTTISESDDDSDDSFSDSGDSDVLPSDDAGSYNYPGTATTSATSPLSFSPTSELENDGWTGGKVHVDPRPNTSAGAATEKTHNPLAAAFPASHYTPSASGWKTSAEMVRPSTANPGTSPMGGSPNGPRRVRRVSNFPINGQRRNVSIDTTMTAASSVGTSVLDEEVNRIGGEKDVLVVVPPLRQASVRAEVEMVNPLRGNPVGMAL